MVIIIPACRRELEELPMDAFKKTTQATPQRDIDLARKRLKETIP